MASLKQTHADYGLNVTITVRETGQQLNLFFPKGKFSTAASIQIGHLNHDAELGIIPTENGGDEGKADMKIELFQEFTSAVKAAEPAPVVEVAPVPEPVVEVAPVSVSVPPAETAPASEVDVDVSTAESTPEPAVE
jgi:hypothetical protein